MTTQRQHNGERGLRGAHVHLETTTAADHITPMVNSVLRGEFRRPDRTRVTLAVGPRCVLNALLSYRTALQDPDYRLKMDEFVSEFKESRDAVYRWIRVLEDEGFVARRRGNDPATGKFAWHLHVRDAPGPLATVTDVKPQVGPSVHFGGDGAAPPVDNLETRRSHHPRKSPGWSDPSMENTDMATLYRETTNTYLPASPPVSDARVDQAEEEEAEPFASTDPPRLTPVAWSARTADEADLQPGEQWKRFVASLTNAQECQGKVAPPRLTQETLAIRAQVANERCGWTIDQLRRYLLGSLQKADSLAGVWAWRLHPDHLPLVPGQSVDPGMATAGDVPTPERRAAIRQAHGLQRGPHWERRMSGGAG